MSATDLGAISPLSSALLGSTTLTYIPATTPSPLLISDPRSPTAGTLTVTVQNNTAATVTVGELMFWLAAPPSGGQLVAWTDPNTGANYQLAPLTSALSSVACTVADSYLWSGTVSSNTNPVSITVQPNNGSGTLAPYTGGSSDVITLTITSQTSYIPSMAVVVVDEKLSGSAFTSAALAIPVLVPVVVFDSLYATTESVSDIAVVQVDNGESMILNWNTNVTDPAQFRIRQSNPSGTVTPQTPTACNSWTSAALTSDTVFTVELLANGTDRPNSRTLWTAVAVTAPTIAATSLSVLGGATVGTLAFSDAGADLSALAITSPGTLSAQALNVGTLTVSGDLSVTSTAPTTFTSLAVTDTLSVSGSLSAAALTSAGPVQVMGAMQPLTMPVTATAPSDGFLVLQVQQQGTDTTQSGTINVTVPAPPDYTDQTPLQFACSGYWDTNSNIFAAQLTSIPVASGTTYTLSTSPGAVPASMSAYFVPLG